MDQVQKDNEEILLPGRMPCSMLFVSACCLSELTHALHAHWSGLFSCIPLPSKGFHCLNMTIWREYEFIYTTDFVSRLTFLKYRAIFNLDSLKPCAARVNQCVF